MSPSNHDTVIEGNIMRTSDFPDIDKLSNSFPAFECLVTSIVVIGSNQRKYFQSIPANILQNIWFLYFSKKNTSKNYNYQTSDFDVYRI